MTTTTGEGAARTRRSWLGILLVGLTSLSMAPTPMQGAVAHASTPRRLSPSQHQASTSFTVLARTGQALPNGHGAFTGFAVPVINDRGLVAFEGLWSDRGRAQDGTGLYVATPRRPLAEVARSGRPIPGGGGVFARPPGDYTSAGAFPFPPRLDAQGRVVYLGDYHAGGNGYYADSSALFGPRPLARPGQPAPGGGTFSFDFDANVPPVVSPDGLVAFLGATCPCDATSHGSGVYLSGPHGLQRIVHRGQRVPEGDGIFEPQSAEDWFGFGPPAVARRGLAAFLARKHRASPGQAWDTGYADGLYLFQQGTLRTLLAQGDPLPAPHGDEQVGALFDPTHVPALNARGDIAVLAQTSRANKAILLLQGHTRVDVMMTGEHDALGQVVCDLTYPSLADSGTLAFVATDSPSGICSGGTRRLYVGTPGHLRAVIATGDPTPGGSGTVTAIDAVNPPMNAGGWVAFGLEVGTQHVLYVYDGASIHRVVGDGDRLAGHTVGGFGFTGTNSPGAVGLNDRGDLAVRVNFSDGSAAVVLVHVAGGHYPGPATVTPTDSPVRLTETPVPPLPTTADTTTVAGQPTETAAPPASATATTASQQTCSAVSVTGVWQGQSTYGVANGTTLTLDQAGTALSGTLDDGNQKYAVTGRMDGTTVTFTAKGASPWDVYTFTGTLSADGQTIQYDSGADGTLMLTFVRQQTVCSQAG